VSTVMVQLVVCLVLSVLVFQVLLQNRYKLNKKYRRLLETNDRDSDNGDLTTLVAEAKVKLQQYFKLILKTYEDRYLYVDDYALSPCERS